MSSELDNEEKATPAGVKKGKKRSTLTAVKKEKKEPMLAAYHGDDDKGEEGAVADYVDPTRPFEDQNLGFARYHEWCILRTELVAKSKPNDIITADPTPKRVHDSFLKIAPCLEPIMKKDSVPRFIRLFQKEEGMYWDLNITSLTLTFMVMHDAMNCAKVVLEGKKAGLGGVHANPNCINPYGYFPLHEAAGRFSVGMIKLLIRHGASANIRTVGNRVIEGLLPLHVAVQNACLHKYLEDNLSSIQDRQDYIYNLIHLLCLPEMKIFLDTIRVLAEETDNLVDEVWNYIKGGKLVEAAVLLLSAQRQIRGGRSLKRNGNGKQNGFEVLEHYVNAATQLDERTTFKHASLLVRMCSQAGKVLDEYIQRHSKVARKRKLSGWDPEYTRRMFYPYWRSVLLDRCLVRVYPSYAPSPPKFEFDLALLNSGDDSMGNGPSTNLNHNLKLSRRIQQPANNQPRRLFATAAFKGYGSSRNPNHNFGLLERIRQPANNH